MKQSMFSSVEVNSNYEQKVLLTFKLDNQEYYGVAIHKTETTSEMLAEYLEDLADKIRRGL